MRSKGLKVLAGTMAAFTVLTGVQYTAAAEGGRFSEYLNKLQEEAEYTKEEALALALKDAGLDEEEVERSRVELDYDDGTLSYDVEFYTENEEYDYEIDAKTGSILSVDREIDKDFRNIGADTEAEYSEEEALEIALKDAKLSENDIGQFRVELERDDGYLIYKVEFYVDNEEYDYELDALTGKILEVDYEIEDDFSGFGADGAEISEEEAVNTALDKVPGATEENVRIKLERDDGYLIYEGEIRYDGIEYEFEINAESGKIISWESESQWDD